MVEKQAGPAVAPKVEEPPIKIAGRTPELDETKVVVEDFNPTLEELARVSKEGGRNPLLVEPERPADFEHMPQSISAQTHVEMEAGKAALARRNRVIIRTP